MFFQGRKAESFECLLQSIQVHESLMVRIHRLKIFEEIRSFVCNYTFDFSQQAE